MLPTSSRPHASDMEHSPESFSASESFSLLDNHPHNSSRVAPIRSNAEPFHRLKEAERNTPLKATGLIREAEPHASAVWGDSSLQESLERCAEVDAMKSVHYNMVMSGRLRTLFGKSFGSKHICTAFSFSLQSSLWCRNGQGHRRLYRARSRILSLFDALPLRKATHRLKENWIPVWAA